MGSQRCASYLVPPTLIPGVMKGQQQDQQQQREEQQPQQQAGGSGFKMIFPAPGKVSPLALPGLLIDFASRFPPRQLEAWKTSTRIRRLCIFNVFSTSNEKRFSFIMICFQLNSSLPLVLSKPKGENQVPSTRIRRRRIYNIFSTSIYRCGHLFIDAAIYK